METKIIETEKVSFSKIKVGNCFIYEGLLCVKLNPFTYAGSSRTHYAATIGSSSSTMPSIDNSTLVVPIANLTAEL